MGEPASDDEMYCVRPDRLGVMGDAIVIGRAGGEDGRAVAGGRGG
jgi:hypothetical protein